MLPSPFDLGLIDSPFLGKFREALARVGYTGENLCRVTGEIPLPFAQSSARERAYRYLFSLHPALMTAISLFLSSSPLPKRDIVPLFGWDLYQALVDRGILRRRGLRGVECPFHLFPFDNAWLFTDRAGGLLQPDRRDAVLHLLQEQEFLSSALLRMPIANALDLCTGSGIFAVLSARFAKHVIATDINPRALNFVAMNSRLNGALNVEAMPGDLYAAVSGRKFDLILANPPYNPSLAPAAERTLSLHSGPSGDNALNSIIRGLPEFLADNGVCQIVTRLFFRTGEEARDRIKMVIDPDAFNVFVLQTQPRKIFTLSNLQKTGWSVPPDKQHSLFDHYRSAQIDRESFAIINFRKVGSGGRYSESIVDFDHLRLAPLWREVEKALSRD